MKIVTGVNRASAARSSQKRGKLHLPSLPGLEFIPRAFPSLERLGYGLSPLPGLNC